MSEWQAFGDELKRRREQQDRSLRSLARAINYDPGALSRLESGQRRPPLDLARTLDETLSAGGELIRLATGRGAVARDAGNAAADESLEFARWASADQVDQLTIDSLSYELTRIATSYVHAPLQPLFADLQTMRDQVWRLLKDRPHPKQARELFFLGGVTVTLLAHATDNMGNPIAAMKQAMAAEKLAEQADHAGLLAWVAGTRALIAEWSGHPGRAVEFAQRGAHYAPKGQQQVRLASLEARSAARLGRAADARDAVRRAEMAAEISTGTDDLGEFGGILTFPPVKARYYAGSTFRLIGDYDDAERYASDAIATYESGSTVERSYGDEALARVDVSISRIAKQDLDGAIVALRPVLDLPPSQHISQIGDGLRQVDRSLVDNRCAKALQAKELREEIALFDTLDDSQGQDG
ncbi:helix-turn-helix domain-containing protein [Millisia brevis]|uniref:helix-turn-helix domain-containing protein n=1 Tax=Millisia brevis TaxID=264148 RepID=UPI000A0370D8|nr:helix-turn-helix transcriptional regulator [Millisia brevis]